MSFQGHIENGVVVFDEPVLLPEGASVRVELVAAPVRKTLAERYKDIIGTVHDLPEDMAENHDHYLHGTPNDDAFFADTFYFCAVNPKDQCHDQAVASAAAFDGAIVTSTWILMEVGDALSREADRSTFLRLVDDLAKDTAAVVIPATQEVFKRRKLFSPPYPQRLVHDRLHNFYHHEGAWIDGGIYGRPPFRTSRFRSTFEIVAAHRSPCGFDRRYGVLISNGPVPSARTILPSSYHRTNSNTLHKLGSSQ